MRADANFLAARIDALLPQTQCTRCGYPSCRDYAQAIADGAAEINQCPPGGAAGIVELARLLDRAPLPLNPANGLEKAAEVALIDEALCIGCVKCIAVCPTDAILGAAKQMHTVIATECSGCELCIPACPVDCIAMRPAARDATAMRALAPQFRRRFEARNARLERERDERDAELARHKAAIGGKRAMRNTVQEAIARASAKKLIAKDTKNTRNRSP